MTETRQRVSFHTQGCRLNQSETAMMSQQLQDAGFAIVDPKSPSDIVIVNTCTVTEHGDADTRRLVNQINRQNPSAKIALVGCLAQIQKDALLALQNVQWVVGNQEKMNMPVLLSEPDGAPGVWVNKIKAESFEIETPAIDEHHTRANLKIQDGCDFYCSFCVIPFARGPARSRVLSNILDEAKVLVQSGHLELVLTGVNIGTYDDSGRDILGLVDELAEIEGLRRIRISSIEPTTVPVAFFDRMNDASHPLCRYLHLPLQSGSTTVLADMARKYNREEWIDFAKMAKATVPNLCLGTDIIVGFPSEGEEEFLDTEAMMQDDYIDYAHVFRYSERPLARSPKRGPGADAATLKDRSQRLRNLSQRAQNRFYLSQIGQDYELLFEQKKDGLWQGITGHFVRVHVESGEDLHRQIRSVHLERMEDGRVIGTLN